MKTSGMADPGFLCDIFQREACAAEFGRGASEPVNCLVEAHFFRWTLAPLDSSFAPLATALSSADAISTSRLLTI
jgi:hypothetical protein